MKQEKYREMQEELEKQREKSKEPLSLNQTVEDEIISAGYGKSEKPVQVFSPSQVGYCKRQMYNHKADLTGIDRYVQGVMHQGTINHYWLEHNLPELFSDRAVETERKFRKKISLEEKEFDLYLSGYADVVDSEGYVYDHKFTGATKYIKDGPRIKDKRQVMMYTYCLPDAHTGKLEYVLRDGKFDKSDYQPYILEYIIEFEPATFSDTIQNMMDVTEELKDRQGTDREHVNPFDRCDRDDGDPCFYCEGDHKDFKQETKRKLKEMEEWEAQVKA